MSDDPPSIIAKIREKRRHYKVDSRFVGDLYTLTYNDDKYNDQIVASDDAVSESAVRNNRHRSSTLIVFFVLFFSCPHPLAETHQPRGDPSSTGHGPGHGRGPQRPGPQTQPTVATAQRHADADLLHERELLGQRVVGGSGVQRRCLEACVGRLLVDLDTGQTAAAAAADTEAPAPATATATRAEAATARDSAAEAGGAASGVHEAPRRGGLLRSSGTPAHGGPLGPGSSQGPGAHAHGARETENEVLAHHRDGQGQSRQGKFCDLPANIIYVFGGSHDKLIFARADQRAAGRGSSPSHPHAADRSERQTARGTRRRPSRAHRRPQRGSGRGTHAARRATHGTGLDARRRRGLDPLSVSCRFFQKQSKTKKKPNSQKAQKSLN
ncbi:unnamed protein product [Trichogramma brassicae]|uniref:Uncharacterized protein n=1 Tax=Trichogramma brassicae TaxID=86971 RepID=A0A6H5IYV1_9HYME|nr:unnamed protein product [Trichogramma brassicae]